MGEGFKVGYDELRELGQRLADLKGELEAGIARIEPLLQAVGHDGLRRELVEFNDNWGDRKHELVDRLGQLSDRTVMAAEEYRNVDVAFAEGFSKAASPEPGGR